MADDKSVVHKALNEASQKTETAVLQTIEQHVSNPDFSPEQGVDFLDVKISLMLSYLIELTANIRGELLSLDHAESSRRRFTLLKVVLDKSRGLEKKLRYQIDKLLASGTSTTTFVSTEDPLRLRPDTSALQEHENKETRSIEEGESDADSEDESVDSDLDAARATIAGSRGKKSPSQRSDKEELDDDADGVYRAPRLSAVPYSLDQVDKKSEKEKRKFRRIRASELAQALRSQYGEGPEQEDIHGGSELGRQREAAKRFERLQEEKTQYEEGAMVRLTTTRNEKKERKRLLREESSNLAAIADLGNIVRDASVGDSNKRHENGTESSRKLKLKDRTEEESSITPASKGRRKRIQASNQLQAALFGTDVPHSKKKKKRK